MLFGRANYSRAYHFQLIFSISAGYIGQSQIVVDDLVWG